MVITEVNEQAKNRLIFQDGKSPSPLVGSAAPSSKCCDNRFNPEDLDAANRSVLARATGSLGASGESGPRMTKPT